MNLLQRFLEFIKEENLFHRNDHLLLAVSGGVDSMVLCELCKQAGFNFMIAHCNFQLRGEESKRDEQFVHELASRHGVALVVKLFDTHQYMTENKVSLQVAARELRYAWFNNLLEGKGEEMATFVASPESTSASIINTPKYLLTAHHADDNIETMLMNFFKGTGISGLRGILPKQGNTLRPLLFAHKTAILDFCNENNLSYVEDSSNESDKYTRNFFRHQLLPAIQKVFPRVEENLAKNLIRFREIEKLYIQSVQLHKKKLLEAKGNEVHIPVLKLKKASPLESLTYEIIKDYGFSARQTGEVVDLLDSQSGKFVQSATHRIIKNRKWLVISPADTANSQTIIINGGDKKLVFEEGLLEFKELLVSESSLPTDNAIAYLDESEVVFPLLLRKRKQGDYFYPLGMQKKKKLSRFLSDQKLSLTAKEHVWLLEMNKKIIWVIGQRIDDRFKITGKTKKVLQVTFSPTDSK
ncbi:MAG: tRNA lysidine(34) synthetase TilS [Chitinophagaceae bacterium]